MTERLKFVLSDLVHEQAASAFAAHERRIRERLPDVEIRHRGGTSIRGALTTGDVDLHVRADARTFECARDALAELYEPLYVDAWHAEAAYFAARAADPPVEVALTVRGTLDDFHHGEAWDRIAADPDLLERYNVLKREHEGASPDHYNVAKRSFFRESFELP